MRTILQLGLIALIISVLPFAGLSGQNYHPLPDEDIRVYGDFMLGYVVAPTLQLRGVEEVDNGELLVTNNNVVDDLYTLGSGPCYHDTGNWWAEEIIWNEGMLFLIMADGLKLTIDTRLDEGQGGFLGSANENLNMSATVVSVSEEETAAGLDTVKTFEINLYLKITGGPASNLIIHGQTLSIGKNSGLIRSFPFNAGYLSPNKYAWSIDDQAELKLIANDLSELQPDYLDFFPFEEGDVLHKEIHNFYYLSPNRTTKQKELTFIDRDYNQQTGELILTFDRYTRVLEGITGILYEFLEERRDTAQWVITPDKFLDWEIAPGLFDLIPGEPLLINVEAETAQLELYNYTPGESSRYGQRETTLMRENLKTNQDSVCDYYYSTNLYSYFWERYQFIEGMGGYVFHRISSSTVLESNPVYVSTADLEWGEPHNFAITTTELEAKEPIHIYPNPVRSGQNLRLEAGDRQPESYKIYNSTGKMVQKGTLNPSSDIQKLEIGALDAGLYLLNLTTSSGGLYVERFVVME